jgi:hypothetical protein
MATTWICRASAGNDNYGGTSTSLLASGVDGAINGLAFTSASGAFTSALVGHAIRLINSGTDYGWRTITAVNSATSLTLSGSGMVAASSLSYFIGGPLLTLARLINYTSTPFAAGDTVWMGAGTYRGQVAFQTAGVVGTATLIAGDVTGQFTGDAGEVILSCYNSGDASGSSYAVTGNFQTASTLQARAGITLHFYTFQDFTVYAPIITTSGDVASKPGCAIDFMMANTATQGLVLQRLSVFGPINNTSAALSNQAGIAIFPNADSTAFPTTVQNCSIVLAGSSGSTSTTAASNSGTPTFANVTAGILIANVLNSATNNNFLIRNNLILSANAGNSGANALTGAYAILIFNMGANSTSGGGGQIYGCTFLTPNGIGNMQGFNATLKVYGCAFFCGGTGIGAIGGTGINTIDLRDSQFWGCNKPAALTSGTVENNIRPPSFDIGQSALRKAPVRPFMTPTLGSSIFGIGPRTGQLPTDYLGQARQQNSLSTTQGTVGYMEPYAPGTKETGAANVHNGTASVKLQGFSTHSFQLPVDAIATTLSLYCAYDVSYGTPGTNCDFPLISIRDGAECGVSDQDVAMTTGSANTWQQINVSFTPTSKGIVTVRLVSRAQTAAGVCWFDD